jgi:cation diffusion facilitator family transporter
MDDRGPSGPGDRRPVRRVALASLLAAAGLVAAKLAAALASGSLSLLSEAAHSGLDAVVTGLTLFAVSVAARPPDADHPYGHGKAENVAAMAEALALLGLSIGIGWDAVHRLSGHASAAPVNAAWYAFAVIGLSIAVDATRSRVLARAGRRYSSPALQADAVHFRADLLTSAVVLVGLVAVRLGHPGADAVGGLVIAAYVAFSSLRLGRRSIDALMDRTPEAAVGKIRRAAGSVEGVGEVRRVRLRYAGGQPQADIVVAVSRSVPLELAHATTERVEQAIRSVEPGADVVVHVEPLADEKVVAERVLSIAARHPDVHQVHNVFVARQPDGLHISLHAKFPGTMTLSEAHTIAEQLEADIAAGVEDVARVDTHLEPLEGAATLGEDVTRTHGDLVASVTSLAEAQPEVRNCHEVVITDTQDGLSVVMHCQASARLSVAKVHDASTTIENEVHRHWPAVERVTVHFEPLAD